ncbi:hypothetical protein EZH22_10785 [Xanthobacter dioxanivorans]|uniref:Uncharacterized protein n=1 Tax=Xanthobacter dioxanivorans TaxID=2528964 RepID=A0A974PTB1_9HYPH|nr:hypothetical protein [Xanthobacter dioxanivorans]QRG08720.1 hypothetical protein EZH22_10785 [Xanthobacter dioxanivorans]
MTAKRSHFYAPRLVAVEAELRKRLKPCRLDGFETLDNIRDRNIAMGDRFERRGIEGKHSQDFWLCGPGWACDDPRTCCAACHYASRIERARLTVRLHPRLKASTSPIYLVSVVRKKWRLPPGELHSCDVAGGLAWFLKRLKSLPKGSVKGVIGVDASLHDQGGHRWWQPRLQAVITGPDKVALQAALTPKAGMTPGWLVKIVEVERSHLGNAISQVLARTSRMHVSDAGDDERAGQRTVPLPSRHLAEHDAWLLDQAVTERFRVVGFRPGPAPLFDEKSIRAPRIRLSERLRGCGRPRK